MNMAYDLAEDMTGAVLLSKSARFEGAGHFSPVVTQLLPVKSSGVVKPLRPTSYQSENHLISVAVREFLYTILYDMLLDSLAAEHGMCLLAADPLANGVTKSLQPCIASLLPVAEK